MLLSIVVLWYPSYTILAWHHWLVYVALIWLSVALNVFGSRIIPMYNQIVFVVAVLTLSATTITLLVCSRNNHATAKWIFTDTTNSTGWKSDGFAFVLAVSNAVYAFLGSDCGAHMCEEIQNPGRNVPRVMLYPLALGLFTAFPFACACMAAIVDLKSVINTATGNQFFIVSPSQQNH